MTIMKQPESHQNMMYPADQPPKGPTAQEQPVLSVSRTSQHIQITCTPAALGLHTWSGVSKGDQ